MTEISNPIAAKIAKLAEVAKVSEWNGRYYINLEAARGSRANADLKSKLWIKGDVLTIETAKGYHSDAYIAAKHAIIAIVESAGGSIRAL
jgi:hypothetical protein